MEVLGHHKKACKTKYIPHYNKAIYEKLEFSENTFTKYRKSLEDKSIIKLNRVRSGKAMLIEYRFNWERLKKLKFITPLKKNEFAPVAKKASKPKFQVGHVLTTEDKVKIGDKQFYEVLKYDLDKNGNRKGNGIPIKNNGEIIKRSINAYTNTGEFELVITKSP